MHAAQQLLEWEREAYWQHTVDSLVDAALKNIWVVWRWMSDNCAVGHTGPKDGKCHRVDNSDEREASEADDDQRLLLAQVSHDDDDEGGRVDEERDEYAPKSMDMQSQERHLPP